MQGGAQDFSSVIRHQDVPPSNSTGTGARCKGELEAPPLEVHIRGMSAQIENDESVTASLTKHVRVTGATP